MSFSRPSSSPTAATLMRPPSDSPPRPLLMQPLGYMSLERPALIQPEPGQNIVQPAPGTFDLELSIERLEYSVNDQVRYIKLSIGCRIHSQEAVPACIRCGSWEFFFICTVVTQGLGGDPPASHSEISNRLGAFCRLHEPYSCLRGRGLACRQKTSLSRFTPLNADPGVMTVPHGQLGRGGRGLMAASINPLVSGDDGAGGTYELTRPYQRRAGTLSRSGQGG